MTGLRKRVAIGFLSIVFLLTFSGMVSLFELGRLSRDTDAILRTNRRNIELAKQMLDAAHEQNVALIRLTVFDDRAGEQVCRDCMERLEATLEQALSEATDRTMLDSLSRAVGDMRLLIDDLAMQLELLDAATAHNRSLLRTCDTLQSGIFRRLAQIDWAGQSAGELDRPHYDDRYEEIYGRLAAAINDYMTSTQGSLAPRAELLKTNAYRAVTPVLISLAVMVAIVLMLYYFMSVYCVNPIVRMDKSLANHLTYRTPFAVQGECKDELLGLKEKIETLIAALKQANKQ